MTVKGVFIGYDERGAIKGYARFRLTDKEARKHYLCFATGFPFDLTEYSVLEVEGELMKEEMPAPFAFCKGIKVSSYEVVAPTDKASAIDYVAALGIKGISEKMASRIIDETGLDIKAYFETHPDLTGLVDAVNSKLKGGLSLFDITKAEKLRRKVMATASFKEVCDYLYPFGFSNKLAEQLYKKVGTEKGGSPTLEELKEMLAPKNTNRHGIALTGCYAKCVPIGIPFACADALGKSLGYTAYNKERIKFLVYAAMMKIQDQGNVWSTVESIYNAVRRLSRDGAFRDTSISILAVWAAIFENPALFISEDEGRRVYLYRTWGKEINIANNLKRIEKANKSYAYDSSSVITVEEKNGIVFSESQRKCFGFLKRSGIKLITGGAGTGKTTTISGLIEAFTEMNPDCTVALCAPTGRAAQRMTELCRRFGDSVKASTVHRLLEFRPFGESGTTYNKNNPLPYDLIVVDEMSMMDVFLFDLFLGAVKDGAILILCGDPSQLPPVSAGKVFKDILDCGAFPAVKLDVNYRQASQHDDTYLIVSNANRINEGNPVMETGNSFRLCCLDTEEEMRDKALSLVEKNQSITILSPVKQGIAGTIELNRLLQPRINPNSRNPKNSHIAAKNCVLYVGDKVLFNRNNYAVGYVNGDVGEVVSISGVTATVRIGNETKVIEEKDIPDLSLAYALTVHKSQGSEYEAVVVLLPPCAEHMIARNIVYTAITRAKKKVMVVAPNGALQKATETISGINRRTTLAERINTDEATLKKLKDSAAREALVGKER